MIRKIPVKRSLLFGLIAGSILTSIAWLAGAALSPTKSDHPAIAVIHKEFLEPGQGEGLSDEQWWAELSPVRLILECEARNFTTEWSAASHSTPVTFVELKRENIGAANCIMEKAQQDGFEVKVTEMARCLRNGPADGADWRFSISC